MDKVVTTAAEAVADIAHPTSHVGGATASRGRRNTGVLHRDRIGTQVATGGLPWRYTEDGSVAVASPPKPTAAFEGRTFLLERALSADFAIVRAWKGDRHGNLLFRKAGRNFNPVCAMAGRVAIAEVEELVEPGDLDPDSVHLPGVYIDRVVPLTASQAADKGIERLTTLADRSEIAGE